jgi:2-iminobutanoate/2-iminopropanoate deaminase
MNECGVPLSTHGSGASLLGSSEWFQMKKIVKIVEGVRSPGGHYSHAVIAGDLVFVSCQEPVDLISGEKFEQFEGQVGQCIRNLETILEGVGSSLSQVVKVNAYLSDITRFAEFNSVYRTFFPESPPARTTVGCHLDGVLVEMDCIALLRTSTPNTITSRQGRRKDQDFV